MSQIEPQKDGIEALRSFNNAIVTSRLYPPAAPQVASAVELGYKALRQFLTRYGKLEVSLKNRQPFLGRFPLEEETLSSFSNLIVYRQMESLGVNRLLIDSSMDKFAFGQIISIFNAKINKIHKEGGGIEYITSLGLSSYFPEPGPSVTRETAVPVEHGSTPKKVFKVQSELLAYLFGKDNSLDVREKLVSSFENEDGAVDLLTAGIGYILRELQTKKMMCRSDLFPQILKRSEEFIAHEDRSYVASGLGNVLVDNLRSPALSVLMLQEYPEGFGQNLYDAQLALLNTETLGSIILLLQDQLAKINLKEGDQSPMAQVIKRVLLRLMNTEKGKQFVSSEKAKRLLHEGEQERKKQRIQAGIKGIMQGNVSNLQSAELLEHLPGVVSQIAHSADHSHLETLLQKLVNQLDTGETTDRTQLINSLILISENFVSENEWNYADPLLHRLFKWIRETERSDRLFERAVILLERAMQHYWQNGDEARGDAILSLFHQIRSGTLRKSSISRDIAGHAQDRGIQRSSLPELLNKCFLDPRNDVLSNRLIWQGPVASRFLVESLIEAQDFEHRFKIIDLLTSSDQFVAEIVLERINEHMAWSGKSNLLKLLAETGGEKDGEAVLPYLTHEDFRVQREAFLCLYKIAGKRRKKLLLMALDDSSELIKIEIISALVRFCDPEVTGHLVKLLAEHENFSEKNRNSLLVQLLETLSGCSSPAAVKAVQGFLKNRGRRSTRKISDIVWAEAEKAINILENDQKKDKKWHVQASQLRKNAIRQAVKRGKTSPGQRIITGLAEEQAIRMLLGRGEEEQARKQLVELIAHTTQTRNFVQAEKLREWLIDINETALGDIIRAAEIISHRKDVIDKTHLEIWSKLYEFLTTDEFNSLYHSLQHKKYENEEIVVHQGALQTSLYLINSGKVKLFFRDKGNRVLVKTLGKGEIIGAGSFFDASVWTISVASVGITDISLLRLEKMRQWREDFPGLEQKLRDFCLRFESIEDILSRSARDRRKHERHKISGRVDTLLLDNSGQTTGVSSEVDLFDISHGGVSYWLEILKKENARLILGRKVKIMMPFGDDDGQIVGITGDILAVKENHDSGNEYSVHVKFETAISSLQFNEILLAIQGQSEVEG